jgi:hypothetical protein
MSLPQRDGDHVVDPAPRCPECGDRAVVPGGYTCLPCWRRLTKARETRRTTVTLIGGCAMCGRARAPHEAGYEGLRSTHPFVGSEVEVHAVRVGVDGKPQPPGTAIPAPENGPLRPLRRKGSAASFASTRSRGGRPKLSKNEKTAAANRRREQQAQWVANRRAQQRRDRRRL